uniref:Uncharacterized protein n=1 Tax=Timema bartmani TaxID=61472 RepID=A0A7R9HY82_9NEOP|nr:unnamed protein product [Timema bartmani]
MGQSKCCETIFVKIKLCFCVLILIMCGYGLADVAAERNVSRFALRWNHLGWKVLRLEPRASLRRKTRQYETHPFRPSARVRDRQIIWSGSFSKKSAVSCQSAPKKPWGYCTNQANGFRDYEEVKEETSPSPSKQINVHDIKPACPPILVFHDDSKKVSKETGTNKPTYIKPACPPILVFHDDSKKVSKETGTNKPTQQATVRLNLEEVNPHLFGGRVKNHLEPPSVYTTEIINYLPVLGSQAKPDTSALTNYGTEAASQDATAKMTQTLVGTGPGLRDCFHECWQTRLGGGGARVGVVSTTPASGEGMFHASDYLPPVSGKWKEARKNLVPPDIIPVSGPAYVIVTKCPDGLIFRTLGGWDVLVN